MPAAERQAAAAAVGAASEGGREEAEEEVPSTSAGALLSRLDAAMAGHLELAAHDSLLDPAGIVAAASPLRTSPTDGLRGSVGSGGAFGFGSGNGSWRDGRQEEAPFASGFGFGGGGFGFGAASAASGGGGVSPFFAGRGLDELSPPPQPFSWLPPPIASLGD